MTLQLDGAASTARAALGFVARNRGLTQQILLVDDEAFLIFQETSLNSLQVFSSK